MKNLELRSSLCKSAALMALCIFLIYAFAVSDSGGITGTFSSLLSGILFIFALSIALIVSVFVVFGIYFGILYLYNPEVSKKTYGEFKELSGTAAERLPLKGHCCATKQSAQTKPDSTQEDIQAIKSEQQQLSSRLKTILSSLDTLQSSISKTEETQQTMLEQLNVLSEKHGEMEEGLKDKASSESVVEATKTLSADLASLQSSTAPLSTKLTELEENIATLTAPKEDDLDVQALIDETVSGLNSKVDALQSNVDTLLTSASESSTSETDESTDHRILEYFTDKKDEKIFIDTVQEGVDQEMTYAQIGDLLTEKLSKKAAAIQAEHPSLTKDYIREIRQQNQ